MGGLGLFSLGALGNEEMNESPAVHTDGPLFIAAHVKDAGNSEFTQAVFAPYNVVAVLIPSCLDGFVVNWRGNSSQGRFTDQV